MNYHFLIIFIYTLCKISSVESELYPLKIRIEVLPRPVLVKGGARRTLLIDSYQGAGLCRLETSGSHEVVMHGETADFAISEPNNLIHTVFLEAYETGIAGDSETVEIYVICREVGSDVLRTEKKEVFIYESSDTLIRGEPHFMQLVYDEASREHKTICYDIEGESGDVIEILTQNATKTAIKGELFDEYYMHLIAISYMDGNILSTTDGTKFHDGLFLEWTDEIQTKIIDRDTYRLKYKGISLNIELKNFDVSLRNLNVTIKRSYHTVIGYFMDITVHNLDNYNGFGGLLGRIGNNKFRFFGQAHDGEDMVDSTRIAVEINGEIMFATLHSRARSQCYLLDVEDALYPSTVDSFRSSLLKWN